MVSYANLVLLVQLHGWFPSMHTRHAWVLLEKFFSLDFWVLENLSCYSDPAEDALDQEGCNIALDVCPCTPP